MQSPSSFPDLPPQPGAAHAAGPEIEPAAASPGRPVSGNVAASPSGGAVATTPVRPPHMALRIVTGVIGFASAGGTWLLAVAFFFLGVMAGDSCGARGPCNYDLAVKIVFGGFVLLVVLALTVLIVNLMYVIRPRRATWLQIVILIAGVVVPLLAFVGGFELLFWAYGA